jgi:hypothetical protein
LPIIRGKYPTMWSSLPPEEHAAMLYILSQILGSEHRPSDQIFFNGWLEVFGVSDHPETM